MHDLPVTTPGPHREFRTPNLTLPPKSCDSHVHLFGPHEKFPFSPERSFTPEDVSLDDLQSMHRMMGFERAVLVQSAAHGRDNRVLLDALQRGQGAYRAVALLPPDESVSTVESLDRAGFCGTRIHFAPHLGAPPTRDQIKKLCDTIGQFGWHLEVHTMGTGLQTLASLMSDIAVRIVIDHMGRFDTSQGLRSPDLGLLKDLIQSDDVWVKLSGADRISRDLPSMSDGLAIGRDIFASRPERCIWGSDFPHPNTHGFMPWDHELVNGIETLAPTHSEREKLLVSNPAVCFGFESTTPKESR